MLAVIPLWMLHEATGGCAGLRSERLLAAATPVKMAACPARSVKEWGLLFIWDAQTDICIDFHLVGTIRDTGGFHADPFHPAAQKMFTRLCESMGKRLTITAHRS